jgi:[CysO sulfur-carrier protein]-S-L-cysteine hydrolase
MTSVDAPLSAVPFVIPAPLVEQIQQQVLSSYPAECCGLLFVRDKRDVARVLPMENLQDRLHALDPDSHPRTSRNGFHMDALRVWREVEAAERGGERLLAFYHSHIDCDAYFSQEDRDMAAPPPAGVPIYPDVWHIIVACWPEGLREARAFRWDGRDFIVRAVPGFMWAATVPAAR